MESKALITKDGNKPGLLPFALALGPVINNTTPSSLGAKRSLVQKEKKKREEKYI